MRRASNPPGVHIVARDCSERSADGSNEVRPPEAPLLPMNGFAALFLALGFALPAPASEPARPAMTFFVTSAGLGSGGDLGGLAGADRHCQSLAASAGAGSRTWRAYLSAQSKGGAALVNARERIGKGPWHNAAGALIARDVDELHGPRNNINAATALDERGTPAPGRLHDILTGTRLDGTAPSRLDPDMTCGNWTQGGKEGAAIVGHHDRVSAIDEPWARSWNSAHLTRGCNPPALAELGSGGLFYCFAE